MTFSDMFSFYIFLGMPISFGLMVRGTQKCKSKITMGDLVSMFIASFLPFFREAAICFLFGVFDYVVWEKQ